LLPVPLRFAADQSMPCRETKKTARVAYRPKQAEEVLLRIAPTPVAADQIAVSREVTLARKVIGCAFRLRVDLQTDIAAHPVIAATGAADRPAIEACRLTEVRSLCARPAGVNLD